MFNNNEDIDINNPEMINNEEEQDENENEMENENGYKQITTKNCFAYVRLQNK